MQLMCKDEESCDSTQYKILGRDRVLGFRV